MWKTLWMILLVAGMGGFVIAAVLVAVRALPELMSLLGHSRGSRDGDRRSGPS